jgi:hypothetical protein
MTKQTFHGPGTGSSPAARNKSFEQHSDMAALSALERLQLELAETRQALVEAERQRQQERQRADEAEQERQYERQRNQSTILDKFLEACHVHISKPLAV